MVIICPRARLVEAPGFPSMRVSARPRPIDLMDQCCRRFMSFSRLPLTIREFVGQPRCGLCRCRRVGNTQSLALIRAYGDGGSGAGHWLAQSDELCEQAVGLGARFEKWTRSSPSGCGSPAVGATTPGAPGKMRVCRHVSDVEKPESVVLVPPDSGLSRGRRGA